MRRCAALLLYYPNHTFSRDGNQRVQYQWLPRRLLLVRHGESVANVDREVYSTTPDWRIPLTERGKDQAYDCGRRLRRIIGNEKIYVYHSPYMRTKQTLEEIRKSLDDAQIQGEREDERLREQEMGNYQPMEDMDATWAARNQFSRLYYRFPSGESSADVGDRVSSFFDSLLRERIGLTVPSMNEAVMTDAAEEVAWLGLGRWSGREGGELPTGTPVRSSSSSSKNNTDTGAVGGVGGRGRPSSPSSPSLSSAVAAEEALQLSSSAAAVVTNLGTAAERGVLPPNDLGAGSGDDQNVVIVAHGLLIRLFIGRWFRVPMEVFETMRNPPNCAIVVLERDDALGRLVMTDYSKSLFGSDPLLQMMRFDGREDTQWYRQRFLGIIDPERDAQRSMGDEDDDENHYSRSVAPHEYEPPAMLRDDPPVQRPRGTTTDATDGDDDDTDVEHNHQQQQQQSHFYGDPGRLPQLRPRDPQWAPHARYSLNTSRSRVGSDELPPPRTPQQSEAALASTSSAASPGAGGEATTPTTDDGAATHHHAQKKKKNSGSIQEHTTWTYDQAGESLPNIGPSPPGKETEESVRRLKTYLSKGFW